MDKIKTFKIYTEDTDEEKILVGNDINTALEILENNVSNEFQILFCKNKIDKDKSYAWKKFNLYIKKLKNK